MKAQEVETERIAIFSVYVKHHSLGRIQQESREPAYVEPETGADQDRDVNICQDTDVRP